MQSYESLMKICLSSSQEFQSSCFGKIEAGHLFFLSISTEKESFLEFSSGIISMKYYVVRIS